MFISELAKRSDQLGGFVAALPLVTVLTLIWLYVENQPSTKIVNQAWYTFWYVLPTQPMFPAFPARLPRIGFWPTLLVCLIITALCFGPLAHAVRRFGIELRWRRSSRLALADGPGLHAGPDRVISFHALCLLGSAASMQLFEVIRWGNDSDDVFTGGGNGPDTCFLVRAESVEQAAALVDAQLARTPSEHVEPWAGAVYLLGTDASAATESRILRGPYIQQAYRHGWRHWYRAEPGEPWQEKAGI